MSEPTRHPAAVGRVPSRGVPAPDATTSPTGNAASGDAAYNATHPAVVGRVPPHGVFTPPPDEPPPRRLRRLHRVWPDRDGNISYLLTICVDDRQPVLNNEATFERLVAFLLDSPTRYHWFGRRFVVMPDHLHLIAHMGHESIRLGQWITALKAVVGGLKAREEIPVGAPGLQNAIPDAASGDAAYKTPPAADVGRVPPHGGPIPAHGGPAPAPGNVGRLPSNGATPHEFTRIKRSWRWQDGYHDHKFRTPESEARKWEYVCLNPVRYGLAQRPEEWPFGGEIFYDDTGGPRLVRGTPPLLEMGMLMAENEGGTPPREDEPKTPRQGTRPAT